MERSDYQRVANRGIAQEIFRQSMDDQQQFYTGARGE